MERLQQNDRLKERLDSLYIQLIIFDGDDTLFDTNKLFLQHMNLYVDGILAKLPHLDRERLWGDLENENNKSFLEHSVRQDKWKVVTERLGEIYGSSLVFEEGLPTLTSIYDKIPELFSGNN